MDADIEETPRDLLSRREKRWSMNSQRLEEILAELMKPISDVRRSFDTDLCALLEEYLTEAGLHALAAAEDEDDMPLSQHQPVHSHTNFAELAMLLQQSASIYGRKVDFLYQHVLAVSDSLHNSTIEDLDSTEQASGEAAGETASRRKRRSSGPADFLPIDLEPSAAARREELPARPPPVLPRLFVELEPRAPTVRDLRLRDYTGEPIGLLTDFHVTWRLQDGLLVDELDAGRGGARRCLRPIPLAELQAALAASAPPPLPPPPHCHSPPPPPASPLPPPPLPENCSTPLPAVKNSRKRQSDVKVEEIFEGSLKFSLSKEGALKFSRRQQFLPPAALLAALLGARGAALRRARRALRAARPDDYYAFRGWSLAEGRAARAAALVARQAAALRLSVSGFSPDAAPGCDSDDDGFFELSDLADSEELSHNFTNELPDSPELSAECTAACAWSSWAALGARAEAQPALDVAALATRLLGALEPSASPHTTTSFDDVLRRTAKEPADVSRMFLTTLFLANSGNVEIKPGAPLSLGGFEVALLSRDARRYAAAAAELDPALAAAPAPALDAAN